MSVPDYRKETINVSNLKLGMFVSDLDRPWLDSPFMLQGFLLDDDEQIRQIQSLCRTVVIDRTLSLGEHQVIPQKESTAVLHEGTIAKRKNAATKKHVQKNISKTNFFEILRELNAGRSQTQHTSTRSPEHSKSDVSSDHQLLNIAHIPKDSPVANPLSGATNTSEPNSLTSQLKHDVSNVLGKVKSWLPGRNSLKFLSSSTSGEPEAKRQSSTSDAYSMTIHDNSIPVEEEMAVIYPVFEETEIATKEIFEAIANENKIDLTHVNQILDSMVASIERNPDALMWLAKLKQRDDYAYNHALNVSINLMALAHFMALPKPQIKDLGLAGLLQDIGKVKIPAELLHKEGELTPAEFVLMKTHVQIGLDILNNTENISSTILNIVANHHERINGSGYPSALSAEQISLPAQMAGIMDTYCALTTNKVYAKGIFNQQALEQIYASRDKEFSAVLVNQLIQFFGIYPVSSLVELNSGEVAVVIQQNHVRRLQPRVMVLLAPDKTRNDYPVTLDLIHAPLCPNGETYKIMRGLPPDSYGLNPADFYL